MSWKPEKFCADPVANALYNIAASQADVAEKVGSLLYGLKYSQREGMSIAEAIEAGLTKIAGAIERRQEVDVDQVVNAVESGLNQIATAIVKK